MEPVPDQTGRTNQVPSSPRLVPDSVISPPLRERMAAAGDGERIGLVIELNNNHPEGVDAARRQIVGRIATIAPATEVRELGSYVGTTLTVPQIRDLVKGDARDHDDAAEHSDPVRPAPRWSMHRIWPNFEVHGLICRTVGTTKASAAHRAFNALGQDVVWAVLDSGIDRAHEHFALHDNLAVNGRLAHRNFVGPDDADATRDAFGHGTHVAGIIAGEQRPPANGDRPILAAAWYADDQGSMSVVAQELPGVTGMAPRCKLVSCKVLRDDGSGDLVSLLAALRYIQQLNDDGRTLRVHGVNLSVGYPFDPTWFSAGSTPVCREVDRLVRSGVVVVVAAGNTGYGWAFGPLEQRIRLGFDMTINDPGNAERVITVGSTSVTPFVSGVSYFSSKGPTGDGRQKPDLVAPGERVVSAGAGTLLADAQQHVAGARYVENSGTSMAAPHVSGVAAAFLSVHREFIGRPEEVKQILTRSATDLGRTRNFQGHGLVDAMRAIQAV
ncbi:peptidase S8 [Virgisporangium ochraceum]|uniref:Peptidase S8 n=1 Tax=Virgisporangium ochraceum TaxID=65505 RepID=A0A8J4EH10_9ACTN|nr:peptidase S8 [Virgisporangium ochraceum]